jgi:hypothetical protein
MLNSSHCWYNLFSNVFYTTATYWTLFQLFCATVTYSSREKYSRNLDIHFYEINIVVIYLTIVTCVGMVIAQHSLYSHNKLYRNLHQSAHKRFHVSPPPFECDYREQKQELTIREHKRCPSQKIIIFTKLTGDEFSFLGQKVENDHWNFWMEL